MYSIGIVPLFELLTLAGCYGAVMMNRGEYSQEIISSLTILNQTPKVCNFFPFLILKKCVVLQVNDAAVRIRRFIFRSKIQLFYTQITEQIGGGRRERRGVPPLWLGWRSSGQGPQLNLWGRCQQHRYYKHKKHLAVDSLFRFAFIIWIIFSSLALQPQ